MSRKTFFGTAKQKMLIGDIAGEIKAGFACGKFELENGDIPHLRPMNIDNDCRLTWDGTKYISINFYEDKRNYSLKKGDLLFNNTNSTELVGKSCYINQDYECGFSNHMTRIRVKDSLVDSYFLSLLFFGMWKNRIFETYCHKWVNQSGINTEILANIPIAIPPLDEQERIVALFQSIEQAIIQAEGQEKNLRRLCKALIDGLVSDKPNFGNLLKGKKLQKVCYRDVAKKLMRKIDPAEYGVERIVAGENLESEDFKIRTWGTVGKDFLGPAFHVLFQAGDILYGSRRTYLKKVALADFEGVCANTTYVIRANEEILLQDLLKHIMLSERFTQYSIGVSKGSTNPYINWKDLDNFVFEIPDLETQRVIADLLDEILTNAEKVREQKETLKKLKQKLLNEILG